MPCSAKDMTLNHSHTCQLAKHVIPTNLLTRGPLQRTYLRKVVAADSSYQLIEKLQIHPQVCEA